MKWLFLLLLVFISTQLNAATYAFRSTSFAWETASNNIIWEQTQTGFPIDDDKRVLPIGFTFRFAGVNYTQVRVHSNGVLQFGADTQFHRQFNNTDLPVTSIPPACSGCVAGSQADRLILVYWDDINPRTGGTVRYETKGTGSNRRFVVSWENVPHFNLEGLYNFQVILYENGEFIFQYGTGNASGVSATIGVEVNNNDFTLYAFNSSFSFAGTAIKWFQPSGDPIKLADYWFEERQWSGLPNEVVDWSGNGYSGFTIGNVTSVENGRVCRAAQIPLNTGTRVDGINTNIDVDSAIGNSGSITFWYKGNTAWSQRSNQLFDATAVSNRWFYLTKLSSNRLLFHVSDSVGNAIIAQSSPIATAANEWRHIAVSWQLRTGNNQSVLRIYVDGALVSSRQGTTNGQLPANLGTLFFGDNLNNIVSTSGGSQISADGLLDEIKVYNFEISNNDVIADFLATHPCVILDHIRIEHDGEGLTCLSETINVKACVDPDCVLLLPGFVEVNILANNVSLGSVLLENGQAAFSFDRTQTGEITLSSNSDIGSRNPGRCFNGNTESCIMNFVDAGLVFVLPDDNVSPLPAAHAGLDYSGRLKSVRTNTNTGACEARTSGLKNVELGYECINPNSCAAGQRFWINGNSIAANNSGISNNKTGVSLNFNNAGEADFQYRYSDVGQLKLHASMQLAEDDFGPQVTLVGSSASFVMKPHTLRIAEVYASNPTRTNNGTTNEGSGFAAAGEPFSVVIEVLNAQGQITPNFGMENNPAPRQRTRLEFLERIYPVAGVGGTSTLSVTGNFSLLGNYSGRLGNNEVRWLEAGTIRVRGAIPQNNYLGAGDVLVKEALNIGRFYPQGFRLTSAEVSNTCNTFSYMQQPTIGLAYQLQAENAAGTVLQNYSTGLYAGTAQFAVVAKDNDALNLGNRLVVNTSSWQNGIYQINQTDALFNRLVPAAPDGPFQQLQLGLQLGFELDNRPLLNPNFNASVAGVCTTNCNAIQLGNSLDIRYGRMVLENAFGSEFDQLPLTLRAEYWDGQRFITNNADNCSLSTPVSINRLAGSISPVISGETLPLTAGVSRPLSLLLNAPGVEGSATYEYLSPPWLSFDWTQTGMDNQYPQAEVVFGRYRGNPRLIFWREQ